MDLSYFPTPAHLRKWFEKNHARESELLLGYYKKDSGKPSVTWPESVDEALCFGWIDGIRRSVDAERYSIRFTPRKKGSHWSKVNVERVAVLRQQGRMTEAGEAAFALRKEDKTGRASFEQDVVEFSSSQQKLFKARKAAWAYFSKQSPSYRKAATWHVISAKREETQMKRLDTLIEDSEAGRWLKHLVPRPGKK